MFTLLCAAYGTTPALSADLLDPSFVEDPDIEVVGGTYAAPNAWPSTAALLSGGQQVCTGTLITPDAVLTAAHCVTDGAPNQVRINATSAYAGGEVVNVSSAVYHASYDGWSGPDIAILHLASSSTQPTAVVGTDCVADDMLYDGGDIHVVGFGAVDAAGTQYPGDLMEAVIPIRDADCGSDLLNGTFTTCDPSLRPAGEIAAGGGGVDSCYGDSGGPLYVQWNGETYLTGITSRGFATSQCGNGGIYVRPDSWMGWIENQVGTLPRPVCGTQPPPPAPPTPATPTPPPPTPPTPAPPTPQTPDPQDQTPPTPPDDTPDPGDSEPDPSVPEGPTEETLAEAMTVDTLVMEKNTMGALTLDPLGVLDGAEWTVGESSYADEVEIDGGVLTYRPHLGFTGADLVQVQLTHDGQTTDIEVPVVVMGKGCDHSGGWMQLLTLPRRP